MIECLRARPHLTVGWSAHPGAGTDVARVVALRTKAAAGLVAEVGCASHPRPEHVGAVISAVDAGLCIGPRQESTCHDGQCICDGRQWKLTLASSPSTAIGPCAHGAQLMSQAC